MTSLLIETFRAPSSTRDARALDSARKRIAADLAGRTVWCATPLLDGGAPTQRLRGHLAWADNDGVRAAWLWLLPDVRPDDLVARVRPDDIVVLLDLPSAAPAEAIRARGAHAVWHVTPPDPAPVRAVDAYVIETRSADGARVIAALMPGAGIVAAKELRGGACARHDGWSSLLADVARSDRHECVGGTLRARPAIPAR